MKTNPAILALVAFALVLVGGCGKGKNETSGPANPGGDAAAAALTPKALLAALPKSRLPQPGPAGKLERDGASEWLQQHLAGKPLDVKLRVHDIEIEDSDEAGKYDVNLVVYDPLRGDGWSLNDGIWIDEVKLGGTPCRIELWGEYPVWSKVPREEATKLRDLTNKEIAFQCTVGELDFQEGDDDTRLTCVIAVSKMNPFPAPPPVAATKPEPPPVATRGGAATHLEGLLAGLPQNKRPQPGPEGLPERNEANAWLAENAVGRKVEFDLSVVDIEFSSDGAGGYNIELILLTDPATDETRRLADGIAMGKTAVGRTPCQVQLWGYRPVWQALDSAVAKQRRDVKGKRLRFQAVVEAAEFAEGEDENQLAFDVTVTDVVPLRAVAVPQPKWVRVEVAEGAYALEFPVAPTREDRYALIDDDDQSVVSSVRYAVEVGDFEYATYTYVLKPEQARALRRPGGAEYWVEHHPDIIMKDEPPGAKIVDDRRLTKGKLLGFDIIIARPDGYRASRHRDWFTAERIFAVAVAGPTVEDLRSPEVERFLNSFEYLGEPKPEAVKNALVMPVLPPAPKPIHARDVPRVSFGPDVSEVFLEEDDWLPRRKAKATLVNGKEHGDTRSYGPQRRLLAVEQYEHGVLTGDRLVFHPNGMLAAKLSFKNGREEGMHYAWTAEGQLYGAQQWQAGQAHGPAVAYYLNGVMANFRMFAREKQHGYAMYFAPDGRAYRVERWEDGEQVNQSVVNEQLNRTVPNSPEYRQVLALWDERTRGGWSHEAIAAARAQGLAPPDPNKKIGAWVPLFNGKNLDGWWPNRDPKQFTSWEVKDGVLIGQGKKGHMGYLYRDEDDYEDFHLRAEARINAGGNSGLMLRGGAEDAFDRAWPNGVEVQIATQDRYGVTGALFLTGSGPRSSHPLHHAANEWFTIEAIVRGGRVGVKVNGVLTANEEYPKNSASHPPKGFIALQLNANADTTVEFRKIEVMRLAQ